MAVPVATATLNRSVAIVAASFGRQLELLAADATMILRAVHGLHDGKDYGRDFAGQDPTVPFATATGSLADMIRAGVELRAAVAASVDGMNSASTGEPGLFADAVMNAVESLRQACADPHDAIRLFLLLAIFDRPVAAGSDAIGTEIAALAANAAVLLRRASAIALGEASADVVPSSQQEASAIAQEIGDTIDMVAEEAADRFEDKSYAALSTLRRRLVNDLLARGASLAPIVVRTLPKPLPSLVAAYRLYQDSSRADELVARNDPPHPAFLPVVIEALAR